MFSKPVSVKPLSGAQKRKKKEEQRKITDKLPKIHGFFSASSSKHDEVQQDLQAVEDHPEVCI